VLERVYELAMKRPVLVDIIAGFGVDPKTFRKWLTEDPRIQQAIDRARADLTEQVMAKQITKAKAGDDKAVKQVLNAFRPDLSQPETVINVDNRKVNILPAPKPLETLLQEAPALPEPESDNVPAPGTIERLAYDLGRRGPRG